VEGKKRLREERNEGYTRYVGKKERRRTFSGKVGRKKPEQRGVTKPLLREESLNGKPRRDLSESIEKHQGKVTVAEPVNQRKKKFF